jgi:small subunit ribosomal protein S2
MAGEDHPFGSEAGVRDLRIAFRREERGGKPVRRIMALVSLQQLLLAGAHFGHLTRRWHPKMKPFILMERNGIHLIDLRRTQECLEKACAALRDLASRGEQVLFVGTKPQAREIIGSEARRVGVPYVNERWLGGALTNFQTIRQGIKTLNTLEKKMTDGTFDKISKKERLMIERRREKLLESIGGIRDMNRLPGAMYVVDIRREKIAVAEARRLGIPVFAIVDTNVDPDVVNFPVPANDDAFKSIALITRAITDAVGEGAAVYKASPHLQEAMQETAARDADHRDSRPRDRRPGDDRGGDRRKRVRRSPDQHLGQEKPQPPSENVTPVAEAPRPVDPPAPQE